MPLTFDIRHVLIPNSMPVEKPITLGNLRTAFKSPEGKGILTAWFAPNSEHPVPEGLQTMADDILTWFDPSQRWTLAEIRMGVINAQRMEESSNLSGSFHLDNSLKIKAKVQEPDKFTPVFHFDAKNPPLKKGLIGKQSKVDFPKVFSLEFKNRVRISEQGTAWVLPEKVGDIYSLGHAQTEFTSPYYLGGVNIHLNRRARESFEAFKPETYNEPPRSLAVTVIAHDLGDYLKEQSLLLRRARAKFEKQFSL